ncbi:MAG: helix-turn-helix transcriptional regulator [Elusimicrobia bacterium]|nr:helix-turn-helix transcriptional regulator [Elusimicrobiota bacterium]
MRKDIHSIVGNRIREERQRAGLTMEKLAELAGISTSFVAYIETKGKKASLETIEKISNALRLPVADLFRTMPAPEKDYIYNAAQSFAQLIRDKSQDEIRAALDVAKTTLNSISGAKGKRK